MAGRDRRRNLSAGSQTPDRWAWSQPLSVDTALTSRRSRPSTAKSLLKQIGLLFSSLSMSKKKGKESDEVDKKPPSFGYTGKPSIRSSGYRNSTLQQFQSSVFPMEEILRATKNFYPGLKIGQGSFGDVYKGTLPDGTLVAVKRAKQLRMQNPHADMEFRREIKIMARIEHQSLVRFYGYMECGQERIVVVEYVPNGTLRDHLDRCNGKFLDMGARLDIAIDVAHAVTYLHMYTDHPIIHRDIKSSNILLTESLRAKVADFGFARLGASETAAHVSTQVKGTAGYLDPEYLKTCQLTDRSDVYSFGVLLVELVSARRPIELKREMKQRLTAKWAKKKFIEGNSADVLDPHLAQNTATSLALETVLELACRCMDPVREDRPSMNDCCKVLWSIRKTYRDVVSFSSNITPQFSECASSSSTTARSSNTTGERSGELWRI